MVLPYNNATPQANQAISSTQNPILQNFQSIGAAFNETAGNNFTKLQMQAALVTDPVTAVNQGAVFTKTSNTKTELFYERDQGTAGTIPLTYLSMIRAWASFSGLTPIGGAVPFTNGFNVTSITKASGADWDIVLAGNAVISADFGILCSSGEKSGGGSQEIIYKNVSFAAPVGTFRITTSAITITNLSFMVFQI